MFEQDIYLYSDGQTLKNKLGILDPEVLKDAEDKLATIKHEGALQIALCANEISLDTYKAIHKHLLYDLYPWAGKIRTCDLAKQATLFCKPSFIESQAKEIFQKLQDEKYHVDLQITEYAEKLAILYGDVNMLHPFREGNGRTQKILFQGVAAKSGRSIYWERISTNEHIEAVIDEQKGKPRKMIELFERAVGQL
ncbi:MAG: Fic family protein [Magnetococcales bacterium]|nr:Fic family protein [Magnetococcales bacterium]